MHAAACTLWITFVLIAVAQPRHLPVTGQQAAPRIGPACYAVRLHSDPGTDASIGTNRPFRLSWQESGDARVAQEGTEFPADLHARLETSNRAFHAAWTDVTGTQTELNALLSEPRRESEMSRANEGRTWTIFADSFTRVWSLAGSYFHTSPDGRLQGTGTVSGELGYPIAPGRWNMGTPTPRGMRFRFDMGLKRQNWNHTRLAQFQFASPLALTARDGLRFVVRTDNPRPDVSLTVWLREQDGSWYYVKASIPLVQQRNEGTVCISDFEEAEWVAPENHMDEDFVLDVARLDRLGLGVIDYRGAGTIECELESVEVLPQHEPEVVAADVEVTGRTLSFNGQEYVPPGLFAGFAPHLPMEYRPGAQRTIHHVAPATPTLPRAGETLMIDCFWDRFQPAAYLQRADWSNHLVHMATRYAQAATSGPAPCVEFWNEPYLNWAERSRVNYRGEFFRDDLAAEGAPVLLRNRPDGVREAVPHLAWKRDGGDAWRVHDPSAPAFWSGRANGFIYDTMFHAFGRALKAANPPIVLVGGWGFRWHEEDWAAWDLLYRPTIDRNIDLLDGINYHFYQGDPTCMIGAIETAHAYIVSAHGRRTGFFNTECGDLVDVPATGDLRTPEALRAYRALRVATYNVRDIVYTVAMAPDKVRSRTVIHHDQTPVATEACYGMLRELRGRLVQCRSTAPDVWCVASIDGTDPAAPRADGSNVLTCVLFNNRRVPVPVRLQLMAPRGTRFTGCAAVELRQSGSDIAAPPLASLPAPHLLNDGRHAWSGELGPRSAVRLRLPLSGTPPAGAEVVEQQYVAAETRLPLRFGEAATATIRVPAERWERATDARLRFVLEDVSEGEVVAELGAARIPLPRALTRCSGTRIHELPLPADCRGRDLTLRFDVTSDAHAGGYLDSVSLITVSGSTDPRTSQGRSVVRATESQP